MYLTSKLPTDNTLQHLDQKEIQLIKLHHVIVEVFRKAIHLKHADCFQFKNVII
jgi:hypothetical protein